MARAPDAREGQGRKMFQSGKSLVEIASILDIPEGTIRSWKNRYDWDGNKNATLQKKKRNVAKKRGGQKGNKNAMCNTGGAPERNKNAVTTGEFETLFFHALEEDEKQLITLVHPDKEQLLLQEIQLLTVREYRMLNRIEDLKAAAAGVTDEKKQGMTVVKYKTGFGADGPVDVQEYAGLLGQIQNVEDALTRVQARKQKAIDSLHRFGFDDARLELEIMKVELAAEKVNASDSEMEDDGFLDAMKADVKDIWNGVNE